MWAGGFPRPVPDCENAIQAILGIPKVAAINPTYEHETEWSQRVASDCIWSDPAQEEQEAVSELQGVRGCTRDVCMWVWGWIWGWMCVGVCMCLCVCDCVCNIYNIYDCLFVTSIVTLTVSV